ncbi:hypothetical protein SAMN04488144_1326 [Methylobacterium sp. 190mf]|uniref:hypothetical protein n=1 Tax=Methylobacterium sp. 190mf TaxID=1761798 RepID=UPI00089ED12B|nr:hypothetical protein [Methylobacterium sp. 190mf]SEG64311.1 hypothetical protein SAMN04488144_1326 [Methylobacterium sp. 190mf]
MFPLRFACFAAVVLVGASSSSAVAVDWSAKQRQPDRDLALFHAMEGKVLHSGPDNPGAGGSPGPHNFGARSETPAYVGKWAYRLSWCGNDPGFTDEVPIVLTADKLVGYENECRFKKVVADADGWSVEAMCEGEGRTYRDVFHLRVQGDRLTQRAGGRSTTWQRCTPAASRPKAHKASTNQERIAAGQSLRREFARQCPERHLEWLDGATELRGFEEYGRDLSASGRSALVDAASPDLSKCQAGVDCQSSAYVVAVHRLGWAAAAADSFCRRSRLTCTEPYGCSTGRGGASGSAGRETRWGGAVAAASKAPAPVVPGACRFPELLDREVQQEANRAIAKVGLDWDAAPEKFVMTNLQFTLGTVADPKHLEIAFSNAEDVDKCFPFFKVKREQLRLEYAALRQRVSDTGFDARLEKLPFEIREAVDARKRMCGSAPIKLGTTFVERRDVNGDGSDDFVLDYGQFACGGDAAFFCGTTGCTREIFVSSKGAYVKALDENIRSIRFERIDGRSAMILGLHGSSCGKAGNEACGATLYWNGIKFSPAH